MSGKYKKILVWADNDLDGAACSLLLKWIYSEADITYDEIFEGAFSEKIKQKANSLNDYDLVFIVDLYVPDSEFELIDKLNVTIIDHHKTHESVMQRYKKAKTLIKEYPSACKLIYDTYLKNNDLTNEQKVIVVFADDYDSYNLKYKESLMYHAIVRTYNAPKIKKFIDAFQNGHRKFNLQEQNSIALYIKKIKEQIKTSEVFIGKLNNYKVVACYINHAPNEVLHYMINKYNADVGIGINLQYKFVSFRKHKNCKIKLNLLAEKLCEGGGHECSAGGKLTDKFIELTKIFHPINES